VSQSQSTFEPVARVDSKPLAERVRLHLLEAILDGRFAGRLPAEGELARMLDVSRTTLRTALHGLERDGVVTRRRAVGTTINAHVSPAALAWHRLVDFDWVLQKTGYSVEVEITAATGPAPADAATIFSIPDTTTCFTTTRAYRADGEVAVWIRDIVPLASLPGGAPPGAPPGSLPDLARRYGRRPIDHAVARVAAAVKRPDSGSTTALPLADGEPFTRLCETHYGADAEIFGYSIIDVDDRFLRLEMFRRTGS
jgi:GntR family transcriptional regulator